MNIEQIKGGTFIVSNRGNLHKTMYAIRQMAKQSSQDPYIISMAKNLASTPNPYKSVFDFAYNNIAYLRDEEGRQQLRYASRSLSEGKGNCTAYSILISALFQAMGVDHRFKVVAYQRGSQKEHIYVVTHPEGIALDPVIGQEQDNTDTLYNRQGGFYNVELPYKTAYLYKP